MSEDIKKISFKTPSKHVESLPLNPIKKFGNFQVSDQNADFKNTRLDKIDEIHQELPNILASKVGAKSGKKAMLASKIAEIYLTIFGKKAKGHKNDIIDEIDNFYKKYVPRVNRNTGNTVVNLTQTDDSLQQNNVFGVNTLGHYDEDEYEETEL